jgi:hypothetical protein
MHNRTFRRAVAVVVQCVIPLGMAPVPTKLDAVSEHGRGPSRGNMAVDSVVTYSRSGQRQLHHGLVWVPENLAREFRKFWPPEAAE